jgi:hypothetical protein
MSEDLRGLLAHRRRERMAAESECVETEDGWRVCVGEFGVFSVPPQTPGSPTGSESHNSDRQPSG